ncbi:glycosyltransferase family 4 protein [Chloroflexota bacterium]
MARILFVTHTSNQGGPNYRLLHLLKHLASQQHQLAVAVPNCGPFLETLASIGIPSYRSKAGGFARSAIPWLFSLIHKKDIDLVYGNNFSSGIRNAMIAAKLASRPFIWHINEMLKEKHPPTLRVAYFLRFAEVLIADSAASASTVRFHVRDRIVHQIYNGIDLGEYEITPTSRCDARLHVRQLLDVPTDQTMITSAGTVCSRKGQLYGVKAAMTILQNYSDVNFAFLGSLDVEPEYANPILENINKTGENKRILFPGFLNDFPSFLMGSDIFLHTALKDPHPIAVLAAMAAELPVVAFAVDGVKEQVIDGGTGYLVPPGNVNGLTECLNKCLGDPTLRQQLGQRGRRRVEAIFTIEQTNRKITSLIDSTFEKL